MPEAPSTRLRLLAMTWLLALALAGLGVRLVFIQGIRPVRAGAGEDAEQTLPIPARRGSIYDAHGTLLAQSRFVYDLKADPVLIGTNAAEFARTVAPILGMPESELLPLVTPRPERRWRSEVTNGPGGIQLTNRVPFLFTNRAVPVRLAVEPAEWESIRSQIRTNFHLGARADAVRDLAAVASAAPGLSGKLRLLAAGELDTLQRIKSSLAAARRLRDELRLQEREIQINGLTAVEQEARAYPLGGLAAHVLGHTRADEIRSVGGLPQRLAGEMGIEWRFDRELQGVPGQRVIRTGKGRELSFLRERDIEPQDGLNVQLTIDARIQNLVERALDEAVRRVQPKGIACIVMRPSTGEVLALGNRPTFDPNRYQDYPVDWRRNRALVDPTEPGSTFKMATYSAALDLGMATMDSAVDCEGGIWSPPSGRPVTDVEGHGLDTVTVAEAFAKSSNVAAAKYGISIPIPVLRDYARRLGYFQRSGLFFREVTLADGRSRSAYGGEHGGIFPREERINTELHGRISYGYGVMVTPFQTTMAASTIANGGRLMRPYLVKRLTTPDGRVVREFGPEVLGRAIRPETAEQMRRMMRRVVTDGTGKKARLEEYAVAGKTGTAHKFVNGRQSNDYYVSTFVGFLPAEAPELCVTVVVDEPRKTRTGGHYGGSACGPVFQQIAREAAAYLALPPSVLEMDGVDVAAGWQAAGLNGGRD